MLEMLNKRRNSAEDNREGGFTLIELMVVVLIIGILIAIAVPTFLGAQRKAKDRAAQSNARQALSSGKTMYTDKSSYFVTSTAGTVSELLTIEPGLGFQVAASTGPNQISTVAAADGESIVYAVLSKNNNCFWVRDSVKAATGTPPGGTYFGRTDGIGAGLCDGASPPASMFKTAELASW